MASKEEPEVDEKSTGARAMHWGVMTWVGNGAGCLVGMIPLALPISIILTVVTLLTGIWAMVLGAPSLRRSKGSDDSARREGAIGFWLGAAHVVVVVIIAIVALIGMRRGWLEQLGLM